MEGKSQNEKNRYGKLVVGNWKCYLLRPIHLMKLLKQQEKQTMGIVAVDL